MNARLNLNMVYDPEMAIQRRESILIEPQEVIDGRSDRMTEEEFESIVLQLSEENRLKLLVFVMALLKREAVSA